MAYLTPGFYSLALILVMLTMWYVSVLCWRPIDCLAHLGSLALQPPEMLAIPLPLDGSLVNSSFAGPEPQSSGSLPYFPQEAVSSNPPVLL